MEKLDFTREQLQVLTVGELQGYLNDCNIKLLVEGSQYSLVDVIHIYLNKNN
ncbi:hypothetical protein [Echinicola shivajiensis]|uniref:hypothetical protein n=1 Tax=Echinicola shivajiensis TaxID=1035916 RepID=UPI001BFC854C|nr:hypothetical protein [Echinicola shivajiensis]